ncbi:MAG: alanine racemase [Polyangiaceae bacterium]|jgi:alanine racemase/UDP-N-acetylmuramoyl-tripeptide--D-alanyl-D-alanine ligase|nr:alanine racemase [Polyangiaceae bacterium]
MIDLATLNELVGGRLQGDPTTRVLAVSTDSRQRRPGALFVALGGRRQDGHAFLDEAARNGAVAALVAEGRSEVPGVIPRVWVPSPLAALQRLAAWYRRRHLGQVVAITGSNGKTITKDALARILQAARPDVAASPGSYNSQLGVALALLQSPASAPLGVFEAGISAPGEMDQLRAMLAPDHGLLTNIGLSHIASFRDQTHLATEKLRLFADMPGWTLLPPTPLLRALAPSHLRDPRWTDEVPPWSEAPRLTPAGTRLTLRFDGEAHELLLQTRSPELVDDLLLAARAAYLLGLRGPLIAAALDRYTPPPTRLEVWRSPGGVTLVNDAISSDPLSVRAALRATAALAPVGRKFFVFGGMGELGTLAEAEHRAVGAAAAELGFRHLLLLGEEERGSTEAGFREGNPQGQVTHLGSREELGRRLGEVTRAGDVVLLKGRRAQGIAEVAGELFGAMAPSRLLVDLRAVGENVARFRARYPGIRILAVVKALAYGSALAEVAEAIGQIPVDYLGVTTVDEGVQLRGSGTDLPILVTLVTADEAPKLPGHRLTVALSSFSLIDPLAAAARHAGTPLDVHLKIDTGMGRLGVLPHEALPLALAARATGWLRVTGAMTHFSAADDPALDDLTRLQIARFNGALTALEAAGFPGLLTHASASAGASRFPEASYGMLRLGLALHGVASSPATIEAMPLELAVSLVSKIAQIREVPRGWTVGYGATYRVEKDSLRMGVIPLGYHDGLPRSLSNRGWVLVEGQRAPMIGRISMDSVLVDLSDAPEAREGSEVLLFGRHHGAELRPEELAEAGGTIAYELLARIGPRVQRVYIGG